ncbi:MarR family transcriptional regulator [Bacillus pseudomycoides]|nr:MarR family transcriptional regulator [Bacillus pseudomycoides]
MEKKPYYKYYELSSKARFFLYVLSDNNGNLEMTHEKLCEVLGVSKTTLLKVIKELEDVGFIEVKRERGSQKPNTYILKK